jgi:ABC-type uncharacterized transport system fused permease/ATPase subunit
VLFLDEASAALDEATEQDIMQHIRLLAAITFLAITHRKSVITDADNVVCLKEDRRCHCLQSRFCCSRMPCASGRNIRVVNLEVCDQPQAMERLRNS